MIIDLKEPLEVAKEKELFEKLNKQGDLDARTSLIEHNLRLVLLICNRFKNLSIEFDDMFSIGSIGLIKAVDNFDISKKLRFSTFAARCIENEILLYVRKHRKKNYWEISMHSYIRNQENEEIEIMDTILNVDKQLEYVETRLLIKSLRRALKYLDNTEKIIVESLYEKNLTQEELSKKLKISQSLTSRKKRQVLNKLRLLLNTI